jgi:hypothetical protein
LGYHQMIALLVRQDQRVQIKTTSTVGAAGS